MNKILKIIIAALGGIEAIVSVMLPSVVTILWINHFGLNEWRGYILFFAGLLASLTRSIKYIIPILERNNE